MNSEMTSTDGIYQTNDIITSDNTHVILNIPLCIKYIDTICLYYKIYRRRHIS